MPPENDTPKDDKPTPTPAPVPAPSPVPSLPTPPPPALWLDGSPYDPAKAKELADKLAAAEAFKTDADAKLARLAELEAQQKAAEDAALSEQEKLARKAEQAEKHLTDAQTTWTAERQTLLNTILDLTVKLEAKELNIRDVDAAAKLMDRSKLEIDAQTGLPRNTRKVLEALINEKSYLVEATPAPAGNTPSPKPAGRTPTGRITAPVPFR